MNKNSNNKKKSNYKLMYNEKEAIFKFLNPNDNDQLSQLNGSDLQDLIILIDDYYIQLRNKLGFEKYITFGLELEFENAMKEKIDQKLATMFPNEEWRTTYDGSLHNGAEIDSPVLKDTKKTWLDLNKVCSVVQKLATIEKSAGGHIHIGTQTLGNKETSWLNFIKIWSVYENIIFRFTYGDYLTARPNINLYAEPTSKIFWEDYQELKATKASLEAIINKLEHQEYQAVNFYNVVKDKCDEYQAYNTIEFRCPNGTLDPAIWQNNVNLLVNLLCYSKSSLYNDDIIEQRQNINKDKYNEIKWYDEIYLDQALELCDMLFQNNFDKIYFLRQYLKSYQITKNNCYLKANKLTKKGIKRITRKI